MNIRGVGPRAAISQAFLRVPPPKLNSDHFPTPAFKCGNRQKQLKTNMRATQKQVRPQDILQLFFILNSYPISDNCFYAVFVLSSRPSGFSHLQSISSKYLMPEGLIHIQSETSSTRIARRHDDKRKRPRRESGALDRVPCCDPPIWRKRVSRISSFSPATAVQ
jgi:hypothetical protein